MGLIEIANDDDSDVREMLFRKFKEYGISNEEINENTQLRNIPDLDSLDYLQITMDIESELKIDLGIIDYEERSNIGEWIRYIEDKVKKRRGENYEQ